MISPRIIIHGGAGSAIGDGRRKKVRNALGRIRDEVWELLTDGADARQAVVEGCRRLEDDTLFNAGTGAVLQSDGQVRLSASMMENDAGHFSGVVNARRLRHPIDVARFLQDERDRVIAAPGVQELLRELEIPVHEPVTKKRLKKWAKNRGKNVDSATDELVADDDPGFEDGHGTVGVVVRDTKGRLAAGTSTGGRGHERVGRVSDCATPAGNYAGESAAISCTGIGEDILDEGLATRIAVRVEDGLTLPDALRRTFDEAERRERSFGVIAIDDQGDIGWAKTSDVLLSAWRSDVGRGDTLELDHGTIVSEPNATSGGTT